MGFWSNVKKALQKIVKPPPISPPPIRRSTRAPKRKPVSRPTPPPIPRVTQPDFAEMLPAAWSRRSKDMFVDTFGGDSPVIRDWAAQELYYRAYFDFTAPTWVKRNARKDLERYMQSTYGVSFNRVFDWEAYKEAYGIGDM